MGALTFAHYDLKKNMIYMTAFGSKKKITEERGTRGRDTWEQLHGGCTVVFRKQGRNLANLKSRRYFRFFPPPMTCTVSTWSCSSGCDSWISTRDEQTFFFFLFIYSVTDSYGGC